jgi:glycosyltransferase involved in cell wall biosynthesis
MNKGFQSRSGIRKLGGYAINCVPGDAGRGETRIAFNTRLLEAAWGGANQFLRQFAPYLAARGVEVVYDLDPWVTHIFILDPRPIETSTFTLKDVARFKRQFPETVVINRVNNCNKKYTESDTGPGYEDMDRVMMEASALATHSVFISHWLKDYFVGEGYGQYADCPVIQNAADPETFFPGESAWDGQRPIRCVTHHWSNSWMKGFRVYEEVDRLIADGDLPGFELTVIGRWPEEIQWRAAKTISPCEGGELAEHLRQQDLYLTASLWEPGGMHFIEGMQCGLPVVFHEDGGGIPEIAARAGVGFREDIKGALLRARDDYSALREKALREKPSGQKLCRQFGEFIFKK